MKKIRLITPKKYHSWIGHWQYPPKPRQKHDFFKHEFARQLIMGRNLFGSIIQAVKCFKHQII